jgi:DNA uptake protein ComE-like DNA-binding protein
MGGLALACLGVLMAFGPPAAAASSSASAAASAAAPSGQPAATPARKAASAAPVALVDINSASRKELKTLPGVGDAEAGRIIAGRPYLSKTDLVSDAGIPTGVYLSIRHRIVAVQNKAARAKFQATAKAGAKSQASAPAAR